MIDILYSEYFDMFIGIVVAVLSATIYMSKF